MYGAVLEAGDAFLFLGQTQQGEPDTHRQKTLFLMISGTANNKNSGKQHRGNAGLQVKVL